MKIAYWICATIWEALSEIQFFESWCGMTVRYVITDPQKKEHVAVSAEEYYAMIHYLQQEFGKTCDLLIRAEFIETVNFSRKEGDSVEAA